MADRPCKPDADLKRLWKMLLPGTQFPDCGIPESPRAVAREVVEVEKELSDDEVNGAPET
jgi:hypothetical protein